MNFSAFASPFAGIHPFAAKFSHDAPGVFSSATNMNQDMHNNRYHSNGNNFNQISTSSTYAIVDNGENFDYTFSALYVFMLYFCMELWQWRVYRFLTVGLRVSHV